ncbi:retinoid-inducible serine carboxypeptidase-like [Leptopilina boulardi]|uniref:retinoid-inducible serine carboxypeptidase-like n=1 Tax=Leptopilina boulardi TaxID=63433 RepID=UPI0021F5728F|nr:retinoid-inducible serine carboxypeptidase-like [Leptopilina boulardi]
MFAKNIILIVLLGIFPVSYGKSGFGSGEQEWGYVNVRPDAEMFWWLYYTTANVSNYFEKPLVIWLQGGPGMSSSGFGNFEEIGPLDSNVTDRNNTWVKEYNVLFVDNPVGAGFSYTTTKDALTRTNKQIALDLLVFIKNFLENFPNFANVSTYIIGVSYGGKMTVEFAYLWYKAQEKGEINSNLKGVGLGDSWISPIDSVLTWAPFLLETGMVDTEGYQQIMKSANKTKVAVEKEEWKLAFDLWMDTEQEIINVTKSISFNNILDKSSVNESTFSNDLEELMNSKVKEALKLNSTFNNQFSEVFTTLSEDFMKPTTDIVELLLNKTDIKVFVYTGQLDLIVDTPGTLIWVEKLQWDNAERWRKAPRKPVVVNNIIEGYVKAYGNLKMYWINRAGHIVAKDNPVGVASMLKDLTSNS